MASGLEATKRRMRSIESTKKITKAMELVATVKLKTWKDAMQENTDYTSTVIALMQDVFSRVDHLDSPYLKEQESDASLYILVTSTLGLCAGYNYNMLKFADQKIQDNDDIIVIGQKGYYHYRTRKEHLILDYLDEGNRMDQRMVNQLAAFIESEFLKGKYKKVSLLYTHYVNSLTFVPEEIPLLPLTLEKKEEQQHKDIIMEPSPKAILLSFIPFYTRTILYGKLLEALVSEQASRRTAMENATDNADEIYQQLKLDYNKERQASITQEITEVVGGSLHK